MALSPYVFHITKLKSPILRTIVPTVGAAVAIQTAFAIPSIIAESERFYDFSGALTFLTCTGLSLYLQTRQGRLVRHGSNLLPSLVGPTGQAVFNWRQLVLGVAVSVWAARLGYYLFGRILSEGKDSRFDEIKKHRHKFAVAFLGQAAWVSCCLMPVMALSTVPASAFSSIPRLVSSDVLGLGLWLFGFAYEVAADRQKKAWAQAKRLKLHDQDFITSGLWSRSRFPNYFGEITLWTGIAVISFGIICRDPVKSAIGLRRGWLGLATAFGLTATSPAFTAFLLLKVSGVPLSEKKYDGKFGHRGDYQKWKNETPKIVPRFF